MKKGPAQAEKTNRVGSPSNQRKSSGFLPMRNDLNRGID
jgi:hypothetical protein